MSDSGLYFWLAAAGLMLVAAMYNWWIDPRSRARRAIDDLKRTRIVAVEDGVRVRIAGVAAARSETTASLVSGKPCLGYRLVIEGTDVADNPLPTITREQMKSFVVDDGTGQAVVEGPFVFGMDVDDAAWSNVPASVLQILDDEGVSVAMGTTIEFTESRLAVGDLVEVVGRASVTIDPNGMSPHHRSPPMSFRIVGTAEEPVLLAEAEGLPRPPPYR